MKKTFLKHLNAILGAAVVGLTGAGTGCKTVKVSQAEQNKDRIIEELRMELEQCRQAQEEREMPRVRLLYGPPPARFEATESTHEAGDTPLTTSTESPSEQ